MAPECCIIQNQLSNIVLENICFIEGISNLSILNI